jgi:hypothetical protein
MNHPIGGRLHKARIDSKKNSLMGESKRPALLYKENFSKMIEMMERQEWIPPRNRVFPIAEYVSDLSR